MHRTQAEINDSDFHRWYIDTFYPTASEDVMRHYRGYVTCRVSPNSCGTEHMGYDITSAVHLAARSPDVYFAFLWAENSMDSGPSRAVMTLDEILFMVPYYLDADWSDWATQTLNNTAYNAEFETGYDDSDLKEVLDDIRANIMGNKVGTIWASVDEPYHRGHGELPLSFLHSDHEDDQPDVHPYSCTSAAPLTTTGLANSKSGVGTLISKDHGSQRERRVSMM
jgi:hypothetical protein